MAFAFGGPAGSGFQFNQGFSGGGFVQQPPGGGFGGFDPQTFIGEATRELAERGANRLFDELGLGEDFSGAESGQDPGIFTTGGGTTGGGVFGSGSGTGGFRAPEDSTNGDAQQVTLLGDASNLVQYLVLGFVAYILARAFGVID
jgi:hypothetical protein